MGDDAKAIIIVRKAASTALIDPKHVHEMAQPPVVLAMEQAIEAFCRLQRHWKMARPATVDETSGQLLEAEGASGGTGCSVTEHIIAIEGATNGLDLVGAGHRIRILGDTSH